MVQHAFIVIKLLLIVIGVDVHEAVPQPLGNLLKVICDYLSTKNALLYYTMFKTY